MLGGSISWCYLSFDQSIASTWTIVEPLKVLKKDTLAAGLARFPGAFELSGPDPRYLNWLNWMEEAGDMLPLSQHHFGAVGFYFRGTNESELIYDTNLVDPRGTSACRR